jgi:hypothetical protein
MEADGMRLVSSPDALPAGLLGGSGFFSTAAWWRTVVAAGVPAGAEAVFAVHGDGDGAVLWPLLRRADGGFEALTNPYTCRYQPAAGERADLHGAGRALARLGRGGGVLRLDALDPDWAGLPAVLAGARAGGMAALRFDHFGNWHEAIAGRDWRGYLAGRPGALRETVRRRLRDAERNPALSFAVLEGAREVEGGIAEYEAVYARSWKEPEPFPDFNAELMRQTAREGTLRLSVLRHAGVAIAVQMWIVHDGIAAVLKLAHDEAHKPLSPGTALTAWTLRRLIEGEGVDGIDFGRGDDPYKQLWTSRRRQRIGVVLAAPWHPRGLAVLLRHAGGRLRERVRR